ncbi:MAG TPA: hypothetical protein DCS85_00515 [Verrucomicrobiales bacterium]|nr:hypothetical protein [Verrucomicrobiales bacterium]
MMKSLLFTLLLVLGVAHAGAFLAIWELPYLRNHITIEAVGHKMSKILKWNKREESLRKARAQATGEN